jgi:hypothetical protein
MAVFGYNVNVRFFSGKMQTKNKHMQGLLPYVPAREIREVRRR